MVALVLDGLVGFPAGLSPTSLLLSPSSFHLSLRLGACGRVPGWLVSHFLSFSVLVVGRLVSHFLECVSHFFSIDSQAGCLWSGFRLACRPLPCFCFPFFFSCLPLLFICLPGWVLVVGFPGGLSPTSLHLSPTFSPNSLLLGFLNSFSRRVRPLSQVCHWWCPPFSAGRVAFLFICLPGLSLLAMHHFYSFVPQVCHLRCPPFSAGDATFLFICFPGVTANVAFLFICLPSLSLVVSALFCWPCSISIHLSATSVTAGVCTFPLAM